MKPVVRWVMTNKGWKVIYENRSLDFGASNIGRLEESDVFLLLQIKVAA